MLVRGEEGSQGSASLGAQGRRGCPHSSCWNFCEGLRAAERDVGLGGLLPRLPLHESPEPGESESTQHGACCARDDDVAMGVKRK